MKNRQKNQKGISLLEVLLSLTIIAIILVMAVRYFFVAENNNRVNTTREDVGSVIAAVNAWKGKNPQYTDGLSILTLYQGGDFPSSKSLKTDNWQDPTKATEATLYNPWGQVIELTSSSSADPHVTIRTQMQDSNDCASLQNSYSKAICDSTGLFTLSFN